MAIKGPKYVITLWLCVAALAVAPACGSDGSSDGASGASNALTNDVDDDEDGNVDEAGEGQIGPPVIGKGKKSYVHRAM